MPIASRLATGRPTRAPVSEEKPKTQPAPEERWWFPLGSITRIGESAFRWHCVGFVPETGRPFIFSGRLDLQDGVGVLLDEDCDEGEIDEDPSEDWIERYAPFPYVHIYYDGAAEVEDSKLGSWFCIHCHYGRQRVIVESKCAADTDRYDWKLGRDDL